MLCDVMMRCKTNQGKSSKLTKRFVSKNMHSLQIGADPFWGFERASCCVEPHRHPHPPHKPYTGSHVYTNPPAVACWCWCWWVRPPPFVCASDDSVCIF